MSPKAVQEYLIEEGYRAKVKHEDEGTTVIESGVGGHDFAIVFFRSEPFDGDLDSYHSVLFTSGIEADEISLEKINEANSNSFHLKAHREDGIWIEMAVPVPDNGLPDGMFEEYFSSWTSNLPEFVQELI